MKKLLKNIGKELIKRSIPILKEEFVPIIIAVVRDELKKKKTENAQ